MNIAEKYRVLIIGSGGREHAFTWKVAQSQYVEKIFIAPGNAGTALEPKSENIDINISDTNALISFSKKESINLVIVGPEDPLVNGVTDKFSNEGIKCFGPSSEASQLEGSKDFAKSFMSKHGIPTANYKSFNDVDKAKEYVYEQKLPLVIKADGLAAGKGVVIVEDYKTAENTINDFIKESKYGDASQKIIIEEFLTGQELSYIVMVNGNEILSLATSQDHKTIGEGDIGLNTGGMGAYSPVPFINQELEEKIIREVIKPTVDGLLNDGIHFRGFLYAGLMIDSDLNLKVLEYNCRFGDPETQPIMFRLKSDLVEMIENSFSGNLDKYKIDWNEKSAMGIVLSSSGYPESYKTGQRITGLNEVSSLKNIKVFHSGTKSNENNIFTNGGRVLCVTALGDSLYNAKEEAYSALEKINWEGMYFRKDIGFRVLN